MADSPPPESVVLTPQEAAATARYIGAHGIAYDADDGLIQSVQKKCTEHAAISAVTQPDVERWIEAGPGLAAVCFKNTDTERDIAFRTNGYLALERARAWAEAHHLGRLEVRPWAG